MSDEVMTKIFDANFTTKGAGRGSGLAVSQAIAQTYHGVINVKSAPGEGTTFEVLFPRPVLTSYQDNRVADKSEAKG